MKKTQKLNYSDIFIEIAGLVSHYKSLQLCLLNKPKYHFSLYDGVNLCAWNGGRINKDDWLTPEIVSKFNSRNIGVSLAFTNYEIDDLNDKVGNELLEMLKNNKLNSIIISNLKLNEYIKSKYDYIRICSILSHPNDITINDSLIKHYKDLEQKFDYIVPRFEMCLNSNFYDNINPSKYIIMVNDTCVYGCEQFREHLGAMCEINRKYPNQNPWNILGKENADKIHKCWIKNFNPDIGSKHQRDKYGDLLGMDLNENQILKCLKIGYRGFKIMGREIEDEQEYIWNIETFINRITLAVNKFNSMCE